MDVPFAPYYQDESCTIYNADCRQVLPFLPKFDLLLTDPPYGIALEKHGRGGRHWHVMGDEDQEVGSWVLKNCEDLPVASLG